MRRADDGAEQHTSAYRQSHRSHFVPAEYCSTAFATCLFVFRSSVIVWPGHSPPASTAFVICYPPSVHCPSA
eukprot:6181004-Pleurochrysis_carterae.AAC.1